MVELRKLSLDATKTQVSTVDGQVCVRQQTTDGSSANVVTQVCDGDRVVSVGGFPCLGLDTTEVSKLLTLLLAEQEIVQVVVFPTRGAASTGDDANVGARTKQHTVEEPDTVSHAVLGKWTALGAPIRRKARTVCLLDYCACSHHPGRAKPFDTVPADVANDILYFHFLMLELEVKHHLSKTSKKRRSVAAVEQQQLLNSKVLFALLQDGDAQMHQWYDWLKRIHALHDPMRTNQEFATSYTNALIKVGDVSKYPALCTNCTDCGLPLLRFYNHYHEALRVHFQMRFQSIRCNLVQEGFPDGSDFNPEAFNEISIDGMFQRAYTYNTTLQEWGSFITDQFEAIRRRLR